MVGPVMVKMIRGCASGYTGFNQSSDGFGTDVKIVITIFAASVLK